MRVCSWNRNGKGSGSCLIHRVYQQILQTVEFGLKCQETLVSLKCANQDRMTTMTGQNVGEMKKMSLLTRRFISNAASHAMRNHRLF